jgi:hypothetical protein
MSINIHGKEYITVAERVKAIHASGKFFDITSEILSNDPVIVKATVKIYENDGDSYYILNYLTFTGISAANPDKTIEKQSPYEVAETSAVGRALGFAGYGVVDGIASADEIVKADNDLNGINIEEEINKSKAIKDTSGRTYCENCGAMVSHAVDKFSKEKYGKVLCMNCQKKVLDAEKSK